MAMKSIFGLLFVSLSLMSISKCHASDVRTNFRVTSIENKPLMMVKSDADNRHGNDRFEGFIPDLMASVAKIVGFDYTLQLVADGKYGGLTNYTWNGMVSELINRKTDIVAADLTITKQRMQAIEFTVPFMTSGIGMLMKKPEPVGLSPSFFLKPFTKEVWMCLIIAFLAYSILFFLLSRFSSAEWVQSEITNERQNNLAVCNALYFTIASLTWQNANVSPRGFSTRVLASLWWLFSVIMLCAYIANLSAYLVKQLDMKELANSIKDAETLSEQNEVKYGTIAAGSTYSFFANSQTALYQFMFQEMLNTNPSAFVKSYKDGIERVKQGNFAFFMEHTSIEYQVANDCTLMSVGGILDYKGYGLAVSKGNPFLGTLSNAVMHLQETGELLELKRKWWRKSSSTCDSSSADEGSSLTLHSLHGPFTILAVGVFVAVVLTVIELFWRARSSRAEGESIGGEVVREAKFALCGSGSNPRTNDKRNGQHGENIILERQEHV